MSKESPAYTRNLASDAFHSLNSKREQIQIFVEKIKTLRDCQNYSSEILEKFKFGGPEFKFLYRFLGLALEEAVLAKRYPYLQVSDDPISKAVLKECNACFYERRKALIANVVPDAIKGHKNFRQGLDDFYTETVVPQAKEVFSKYNDYLLGLNATPETAQVAFNTSLSRILKPRFIDLLDPVVVSILSIPRKPLTRSVGKIA